MMDYWSSFAKTGTPKAAGQPAWPAFDKPGGPVMLLGDTVRGRAGAASRSLRGVRRLREGRDVGTGSRRGPVQPGRSTVPATPDVAAAAFRRSSLPRAPHRHLHPARARRLRVELAAGPPVAGHRRDRRGDVHRDPPDRRRRGAARAGPRSATAAGRRSAAAGVHTHEPAAARLFVYAVPFSLAYVRIGAAVGALVLFGVVQLTMVGYGLASGERPRRGPGRGSPWRAAAWCCSPRRQRPVPIRSAWR